VVISHTYIVTGAHDTERRPSLVRRLSSKQTRYRVVNERGLDILFWDRGWKALKVRDISIRPELAGVGSGDGRSRRCLSLSLQARVCARQARVAGTARIHDV
jgi:hypothetical protein